MYLLQMYVLQIFLLLVGEIGDYIVDLLNFTANNTFYSFIFF